MGFLARAVSQIVQFKDKRPWGMSPKFLRQCFRQHGLQPSLFQHIAPSAFLLSPPFPIYFSFPSCFPSPSSSLLSSPLPLSCLLPFFPHSLTLFPFLFYFPLPSSPSPPHSMNPFSSPNRESSPIPGPKPHSLFSIRWEGQGGSPDLLHPAAVGVGLGLHRRAALNDKRRY